MQVLAIWAYFGGLATKCLVAYCVYEQRYHCVRLCYSEIAEYDPKYLPTNVYYCVLPALESARR